MLDLDAARVEKLKEHIITEDEELIRSEFKFRKNAAKYPLVYIEKGEDGLVDRYFVTYVALIQRDEVGDLGTLLIQLQDGRWTCICSAYLHEMQGDADEAGQKPADQFSGESLFC